MRIHFHPDVLKQLQRLPCAELEKALHVIIDLSHEPRPAGAKKLVGSANDWRVRFGQYYTYLVRVLDLNSNQYLR